MDERRYRGIVDVKMFSLVERLEKMEFLFVANFPLFGNTILGAGDGGTRFHPPNDMLGFRACHHLVDESHETARTSCKFSSVHMTGDQKSLKL